MKNKNNRKGKLPFFVVALVLIVIVKLWFDPVSVDNMSDNSKEIYSELGQMVKGTVDVEAKRESIIKYLDINDFDKDIKLSDSRLVAIVIDDMGLNSKMTNAVIDIKIPLTLAFLPYARNLDDYVARALSNGHEVIIHAPMEPISSKVDPGPMYFKSGMSEDEFDDLVNKIFGSFDGYVGINNHMGSKATQDKGLMKKIMKILKKKNIYFLDSKTIVNTVAGDVALEMGVKSITRDVFIDHEDNAGFVSNALDKTLNIAIEVGQSVAIGHPKKHTVDGILNMIENINNKKQSRIKFVTVSTLLK